MSSEREGFLDVLRFVAASAVLLFHFGFRGYAMQGQDLAYPELAGFAMYGYLGVELFFMISGYVIPLSIRERSVADFAVSRAIRLYPTFWLCVALLAAVPPLLGDWRFHRPLGDTLVNLTMLAELFGSPYLDGVFWTLATELQFYALVALVVGVFGFHRLPGALLVWLLIGAGVTAFAKATGTRPFYPGGSFFGYFCFGAACYFLQHLGQRSARIYALFGLSLPLMLAHSTHKAGATTEMFRTPVSLAIVLPLLLASAAAIFFSRRISERMKSAPLLTAAVVFLGGLTYPLYLLHENIGYAVLNTLFSAETRWLGLAYVTALSFAASAAVYLWFDLPVRRRLHRAIGQFATPRGSAR
jgi:peptidoglycan/LPS O-acetylase OafA/YrhL